MTKTNHHIYTVFGISITQYIQIQVVLEKLTDSWMSESQNFSFPQFGIGSIYLTFNSKHIHKTERCVLFYM